MGFVPRDRGTLSDRSLFLQKRSENFRIYYSAETIGQACTTGLYALVADGVHSPQPRKLGRGSQLYCIHGVCGNGVEVPLVFVITARKTKAIYTHLDYEKAAINAARSLFGEAKVVGRAFHMAQAWNRQLDRLGLSKCIIGKARDRRIARWWGTLKGLEFLAKHLRSAVRALRGPPVPIGHQVYRKCQSFLSLATFFTLLLNLFRAVSCFSRCLRTTWMSGSFKDLLCKWRIKELRATNLAEAFHNSDLEAKCALHRLERIPHEGKEPRERDALSKQWIDEEMASFECLYRLRRGQDHHV
ncbi:hypothetical protein Aduo_016170 [Ancylostoma duodenale]